MTERDQSMTEQDQSRTERDPSRTERDRGGGDAEWDLVERGGLRQPFGLPGAAPAGRRRPGGDRGRLRLTTDCWPPPGPVAVHARVWPDDELPPAARIVAGRPVDGSDAGDDEPAASGFSVVVNGVVVRDRRVLLVKNDRQEWELPGGTLVGGETPEQCVVREIAAGTGWAVTCGPILDSWRQQLGRRVFVVTYGCHPAELHSVEVGDGGQPVPLGRRQVGLFTEPAVQGMPMAPQYRRSVQAWFAALRSRADR